MNLIENIVGNIADDLWRQTLAGAVVDLLELDQWAAQKNRMRVRTQSGAEIAISLERGTRLRDGDILSWDPSLRLAVIARVKLQDVMVIHLDGLAGMAPDTRARTCFELGHALGNQHWPAVVKGNQVFVPLTVDRKVMQSVMRTHDFEGIRTEFIPGQEVIPYLAPHEARRLFGGANATPHTHLPPGATSILHRHADGTVHAHPADADHTSD